MRPPPRGSSNAMVSRRVDLDQRVSSPGARLLASVFRGELEKPGSTKTAFCQRVGVTPQYLNLMLAGTGNPSLVTLETMMRGLGRIVAFPHLGSPDEPAGSDSTCVSLPVVERLAALMREELESTGETQLELAHRASVSRFYIRKTIHGLGNPSLLSLETMLKGIGRTIAFPELDATAYAETVYLQGSLVEGSVRKRHAGGRPPRSRAGTANAIRERTPDT